MEWQEAEKACEKLGATLTAVESAEENSLVWTTAFAKSADMMWIGLKASEASHRYKWANSLPLLYENWNLEEDTKSLKRGNSASVSDLENLKGVRPANVGSCVSLMAETGKWSPGSCQRKLHGLCKYTNDTRKKVVGKCPSDEWFDLGGSKCYYREVKEKVPWHTAFLRCFDRGGHLVSITSEEELNDVAKIMKSTYLYLWIGLMKDDKGEFKWSDGKALSIENWEPGEPNLDHEKCTEVTRPGGKWNDLTCTFIRGYLCSAEKKIDVASLNASSVAPTPPVSSSKKSRLDSLSTTPSIEKSKVSSIRFEEVSTATGNSTSAASTDSDRDRSVPRITRTAYTTVKSVQRATTKLSMLKSPGADGTDTYDGHSLRLKSGSEEIERAEPADQKKTLSGGSLAGIIVAIFLVIGCATGLVVFVVARRPVSLDGLRRSRGLYGFDNIIYNTERVDNVGFRREPNIPQRAAQRPDIGTLAETRTLTDDISINSESEGEGHFEEPATKINE